MKKVISLMLMLVFVVGVSFAGGVKLVRVYHLAGDFYRAVVEVNSEVRVKCAALDSEGNYLAVTRPVRITPPVGEVQILVPGATPASARCWVD